MTDLFAYNTETRIRIEAHWCGNCNIPYGLPAGFLDERRRDSNTWTCPNGCRRHYPPGKSDEQKLKDAAARETALRDQLEASIRDGEAQRVELARIRQRIANGVCPCCNRSFGNVRAHMQTQHPDYVAPVVEPFKCSCNRKFDTFRGLRVHQGQMRPDDWARADRDRWSSHLTVGATR